MNIKQKASAALALKVAAALMGVITLGFAFAEATKPRIAHERPAEVTGATGMPVAFGMLAAAAGVVPDPSISKSKALLLLMVACVAASAGPGNLIFQKPQINNIALGITTTVFSSLYPKGLATVAGGLAVPVILASLLELFSSPVSAFMAGHPEGRAFNDALLPLAFTLLATAHAKQEFAKPGNFFNKSCAVSTVMLIVGVCIASFASAFTGVPAPLILGLMAAATVGFSLGGVPDLLQMRRKSRSSEEGEPLLSVTTAAYNTTSLITIPTPNQPSSSTDLSPLTPEV